MADILERDGLSVELLSSLSYKSELGISLKKNLHYFDRDLLLDELFRANEWYQGQSALVDLPIDSRIKSLQSIKLKLDRYWPDHQVRKVFNDLLGFRSIVDSYESVLALSGSDLKVVNLSAGKAIDDGYRGVHLYYVREARCYPIELQYNTFFDRQLNNWLHKYLYKKTVDSSIGAFLRMRYEAGLIHDEAEFRRELADAVSSC